MKDKKRLHFGVIFSTMDNSNQYDIWSGIVEYARKNDIHLTAYFGTYQMTTDDFASHFETCFETVRNSVSLDGVIMFSGFIAHIIGSENFEKYAAGLPSLPVVSVSYVMDGVPSVIVDNMAGMYDAVEHLIQVHQKKRIAFVKGPDGHPEAEERFEGYKRALLANKIPYDDRYVFPGNFDQDSGRKAVRKLFDSLEICADAIAASNDVSAIGVLNELKSYNLSAPADFAVTGFDDDIGSAAFIPSISTARQDFHKFGLAAAELLHNRIEGKPAEKIVSMPPVFMQRQSCGCLEKEFFDAEAVHEHGQTQEADSLISYVSHKFKALFQKEIPELQISKWAAALAGTIKENPFSKEKFLALFNEILIGYNNYSKDFNTWNEALNVLSTGSEFHGDEVANLNTVRSTLTHASTFVHNIRFKEREFKEIASFDKRWMTRRVAGNLVLIFDIDSLAEELYKSLPGISIDTAVIGLYEKPIKSGFAADRTINTLIGFDGDKQFNIKDNREDPIVFSDYSTIGEFDFESKRRDLFFIPLFFKDEEFGILLMPFDPEISVDTYETLRVNISTAIKGAELVKEVKHQNDLLKAALTRANEASKAKSDFLSSMSHEMRTPMNAVIGMTAIGKKVKDLEGKNYALGRIGDASSHLLGVISDILDMSKIEANKLELSPVEFNFDRMLQKVVTVVNSRAEEKSQAVSVKVDKRIPRFIVADEQRLSQVLTNLMSNAVKFTPERGNIRLEASLTDETDESCELRISVADSGIGIAPEQHERVFQAFEQAESGTNRKYGGTGLGLVISKNIVELMGGRIWIESRLGLGAKFIFTVKAARGKRNPHSLLAPDVNWNTVRVLAVDDMPEVREQFQNTLNQFNIKCDVASDGLEACRIIDRRGGYDIYFVDWVMPNMDGIELTRQIKSRNGKRPSVVIMITAMDWEQIKDEALAAGVDKHLLKPLFTSTIIDCVNECFGTAPILNEDAEYAEGEFAGKKLLLAEDVEINREIFISLLSGTGITIDCAENGQRALEMVEESGGGYDIVFMDVQMPKMDGYETTRAIRGLPFMQNVSLPIIAMTANVFKSDIENSLAAGMDDHLGKPIDFDKVLEVLRKYL
ncbi:MAG: response regulator [Oscillospiraceae bacterium]|nr:response regulator [Oscillospiraceae bacterium]